MSKIKFDAKNLIGTALLLLGLAAAVFYILVCERAEFNADFADTLVWAYASLESGSAVAPDFYYPYLLPFGGSLLMMPFVALFGVTYTAHQLSMIVFTLIFAVTLYLFLRSMGLEHFKAASITGAMLVIFLSSPDTRIIFYGHIIHYSIALVFMFVTFIIFNKIDYKGEKLDKRQLKLYCILLLWIFLCCLNGESILMLFFIPFAGALVLERIFKLNEAITWKNIKYPLILMCGIGASGMLGYVVKKIAFKYTSSTYENVVTVLMTTRDWMFTSHNALTAWVKLLTGEVNDMTPIISTNGMICMFRYLLAVTVIVVQVFAAIMYKKLDKKFRYFLLFYWVLMFITLFINSVSYVSNSDWRLCTLLGTAILATALFADRLLNEGNLKRFGLLIFCIIGICVFLNLYSFRMLTPRVKESNRFDPLIKVLEENDLHYGYSSFWNSAFVVDLLSNSDIKIRSINIDKEDGTGEYSVRLYNSTPVWYEDQPDIDRYFVVMDETEYNLSEPLRENAIDMLRCDDLYIMIYDKNIFKDRQPAF